MDPSRIQKLAAAALMAEMIARKKDPTELELAVARCTLLGFEQEDVAGEEFDLIQAKVKELNTKIARLGCPIAPRGVGKRPWNYGANAPPPTLHTGPLNPRTKGFGSGVEEEKEPAEQKKPASVWAPAVDRNRSKPQDKEVLPPNPLRTVKSCNTFTTAFDELRANCELAGKDYREELERVAAKRNKEAPSGWGKDNAKTALGTHKFFGEGSRGGQAGEGAPKRRQFKPPVKEEPAKEDDNPEKESPVALWAQSEGLDLELVRVIEHEIMDKSPAVNWDDIAGLEDAKKVVNETIVFPNLRPDIFTGLRKPGKGILLFGPPGTGKTLIGRAIAGQLESTFFSISSSSLVSKWIGESERLIKTLFRFAAFKQPSVIFIDEIDSMLSARGDAENDAVRRIKTEFLVQIDGAKTDQSDRVLVIGATNRPGEIDEAARRRFTKRLYIPLPNSSARMQLVRTLVKKESGHPPGINISEADLRGIVERLQSYSCSDIVSVMQEAAMGPVRDMMARADGDNCLRWDVATMRPVDSSDVAAAIEAVKSSVSESEIKSYEEFNKKFGTSKIAG